MANLLIEWKVELHPPGVMSTLQRDFNNIDDKLFHDPAFMQGIWNKIAIKIGAYVRDRFKKQGPGWQPLAPKYLAWKRKVVQEGRMIKVGAFGKQKAKFTEIGKLTGIMELSATRKNMYANIFEVEDIPGVEGGSFRWAISGERLPYAKEFDKWREFFFLSEDEANNVLDITSDALAKKIKEVTDKLTVFIKDP